MMERIYVRWRQQAAPETSKGGCCLIAELVKTGRKHNALAETVIKQLATIEERFLTTRARDTRAFHQGLFWAKVDRELTQLKLSPEETEMVQTVLSEKIPRPDDNWALQALSCTIRYDPK